jgi:hypothetical protein
MVRQISQSRDLYTAKVVKATDTPSGFSIWEQIAQGTLQKSAMLNPYDNRCEH